MASTAADFEIQDPPARLDLPGLDRRADRVQRCLVVVEPHATWRDGEITQLPTARNVPELNGEDPANEESAAIGVEHWVAVVASPHPEHRLSIPEIDYGDRFSLSTCQVVLVGADRNPRRIVWGEIHDFLHVPGLEVEQRRRGGHLIAMAGALGGPHGRIEMGSRKDRDPVVDVDELTVLVDVERPGAGS